MWSAYFPSRVELKRIGYTFSRLFCVGTPRLHSSALSIRRRLRALIRLPPRSSPRAPKRLLVLLALCSLHHKIFDLGAFTVLQGNHQIVFSCYLMSGDDTKAKLLAHHGAGLVQPQGKGYLPNPEYLAWRPAEVFKEPARE